MPKKLSSNKKILICLASIFVLATALLLANLISMITFPVSQSSQEVHINSFELHFLAVNKSQNELSAKALANDYQSIGAGGFIWKNGDYFYVASSAYQNKNDALLVQTNLKNSQIESEILSLTFKDFSVNGTFDSEEKKVLQKALTISYISYQNLYDIAISLDTGVYNETSAKLAVNAVHSAISMTLSDYQTLFSNEENEIFKNIDTTLKNIKKISTALCSGTKISEKQTYSSLIKYRYLEILNEYSLLISKE